MRRFLLALAFSLPIGSNRPEAVPASAQSRPPTDLGAAALPSPDQFVELAKTQPIECLKASVRRYKAEYRGFQCVMEKQERIGRRMGPKESIDVWFRDQPHSVLMVWNSAPVGRADRVLFVDGANDNQLLVRPHGRLARRVAGDVVAKDPESPEAKSGGRVSLREFGLKKATERQLAAWEAANKDGRLKVDYLGLKKIPEVGDATCHLFRRTVDPPEGPDRVARVEVGLDADHWLQVYSKLYDPDGQLIGVYAFKDVKVNPEFKPDQFDRDQLTR